MTFSELKKKDMICIGDGRLLGRVGDLEFDLSNGQIRSLAVTAGGCGIFSHGEKNAVTVLWEQIACIGDDVILVSNVSNCGCK